MCLGDFSPPGAPFGLLDGRGNLLIATGVTYGFPLKMMTEEDDTDGDDRMPRDLVTDPGERRDWLEKCRINKLKVGIVIVVVYDHA